MFWQVHSNWTTTRWENRLGPVGLHRSNSAFNPLCNKYEGHCQEHHKLAQCFYTYGYVIEQLIYSSTIDKTSVQKVHIRRLCSDYLCDLCALMNNSTAEHPTAVPTYENWNGKWYSSGGMELWMFSLYVNVTVLTLPSLFRFHCTNSHKVQLNSHWFPEFVVLSNAVAVRDVTCVRFLSSSRVDIISNGLIHLH